MNGAGLTVVRPLVTVVAQAAPVTALDVAFCAPHALALVVHMNRTGLTPNVLEFKHAHTGALVYVAKPGLLSKRKKLQDASGADVVTFKEDVLPGKRLTHVFAGNSSHGASLLEIAADYYNGASTTVAIKFINKATGEHCEVGFEGDWQRRDAHLWLDRGRSGVREPVAKIHGHRGASFRLDVAANMDAVLIAVVCAMLERLQRKYNSVERTNAMAW